MLEGARRSSGLLCCSAAEDVVLFRLFCSVLPWYACVPAVLYTLAVGIAVAKARSERPQACSLVSSVARQRGVFFCRCCCYLRRCSSWENT